MKAESNKEIDDLFNFYQERLWNATMDEHLRLALKRAVEKYRSNRDEALRMYPNTLEKAERLIEIKEQSLLKMEELAKQVKDRVEDLHGNCIIARTPEDAVKYIESIVKKGDIVVKAKSITSEELHINHHLEAAGCEVYETDLGEFIIQQLKMRPMHILSPAIHVPKEKVAQLFSKVFGKPLPPDIKTLVGEARSFLRDKYFRANVGFSGANVVAAETGTIFLIENEGNARLATGLPEKYIGLAGLEKIVPTLEDAMLTTEVTVRYANYKWCSYVSLIGGPSKTGDIEKTTTYGAHGPRELHLILLDNGRTEMIKDSIYRQALYCIRCGGCLYECTTYPMTAGHYGYLYMGGIGAILTAFLLGGLENAAPIAYTCSLCGRCKEVCPMKIDVPEMILKLRKTLADKGYVPAQLREVAKTIIENGSL
jgi:L-lactate dehydrogenase complex protein LldG